MARGLVLKRVNTLVHSAQRQPIKQNKSQKCRLRCMIYNSSPSIRTPYRPCLSCVCCCFILLVISLQIVTGLNCQRCAAALCEQSEPFSAWGPGPALGPWKLLAISLLNMHSLQFGVPFYTICEIIKY